MIRDSFELKYRKNFSIREFSFAATHIETDRYNESGAIEKRPRIFIQ